MPNLPANPPRPVPQPGVVPVGLATKLGVGAGALAGVLAGVAALLDGDHSEETITLIVAGVLSIYGVIRGRSDQAAAALSRPETPLSNDPRFP